MSDALKDLAELKNIPEFEEMIPEEEWKYTAHTLHTMQINVGKLCNLSCKHCHVEAGPSRTEIMKKNIIDACMEVCEQLNIETIDITGGAPEMNPHFEYLVEEAVKRCGHVIVRSNLVILEDNKYKHLPKFLADHGVEIVCSLPYYRSKEMDRVRGQGTFDQAIRVIKSLNELGYGKDERLVLNMVYNPSGAFFPPAQSAMEREYKEKLWNDYEIVFNHLFTITNNPMGRFETFLKKSGNLMSYMQKLYQAFNVGTLPGMMCRYQLSVAYDGRLYDCDFNQAAGLPIKEQMTIFDMIGKPFERRKICFGRHCYGCSAGQGSSCGGATE